MAQTTKNVMVYKNQEGTQGQDQGQGHKEKRFAIHGGKKMLSLSLRSTHAHRLAAIITTKNT